MHILFNIVVELFNFTEFGNYKQELHLQIESTNQINKIKHEIILNFHENQFQNNILYEQNRKK